MLGIGALHRARCFRLHKFYEEYNIPAICIPGTIDNDIAGTGRNNVRLRRLTGENKSRGADQGIGCEGWDDKRTPKQRGKS